MLVVGGESDGATTDLAAWKSVLGGDNEAAPTTCTVTTKLFKGGHFYYQDTPEALLFIAAFCSRVLG